MLRQRDDNDTVTVLIGFSCALIAHAEVTTSKKSLVLISEHDHRLVLLASLHGWLFLLLLLLTNIETATFR